MIYLHPPDLYAQRAAREASRIRYSIVFFGCTNIHEPVVVVERILSNRTMLRKAVVYSGAVKISGSLNPWRLIRPIVVPARRQLAQNVVRAEIGPDKSQVTSQTGSF